MTIGRRIHRLLERRGHGAAGASSDICPSSEEALLAQCYEESLFGRDTERVGRLPSPDREPYTVDGARCAAAGGFTLHANTEVPAGDVSGLERLCRYVLRPSIASERLRMTAVLSQSLSSLSGRVLVSELPRMPSREPCHCYNVRYNTVAGARLGRG